MLQQHLWQFFRSWLLANTLRDQSFDQSYRLP